MTARPRPVPQIHTTGVLIAELLGDDDGPWSPYAQTWISNPLTVSPVMARLIPDWRELRR